MSLFRRRVEPVPEWAPFADPADWQAFAEVARAEAKAREWRLDLESGWARGGEARYGLHNVAQACRQEPRAGWARHVREHFDRTVSAHSGRGFGSAEEARAALKARLVDDGFFAHATIEPVWRRVADTLRLALAFDLPETVVIADRGEVLEWGEEDELFEVALANTRMEGGLELERHSLDDEAAIWSLSGESFFTATYALWADGFDPPPSADGTLVAIPTRHIVLAHPVRGAATIRALQVVVEMATGMFAEGPGSLSDRLYWLRDGALTRLDASFDRGHLSFVPSDEFLAVMETWD